MNVQQVEAQFQQVFDVLEDIAIDWSASDMAYMLDDEGQVTVANTLITVDSNYLCVMGYTVYSDDDSAYKVYLSNIHKNVMQSVISSEFELDKGILIETLKELGVSYV